MAFHTSQLASLARTNHLDPLEYPRVLVVNLQAIGQRSGVGATLASLFRGWPRDRLAQIIPVGSEPDQSICSNNWILAPLVDQLGCADHSVIAFWRRKVNRARGYRIGTDLKNWVSTFQPQLVYSYLEAPLITNLVLQLADCFRLPIVPHFMDEWQDRLRGRRFSDYWWFIRRKIDLCGVLKRAPLCLAISDAMSCEYQKRYHLPFYTFMNSADPDIYKPLQHKDDTDPPVLRMIYAGSGLGFGRESIIQNLVVAVRELNYEGHSVDFTILVRRDICGDFIPQEVGIHVRDYVEEKELAGLLARSDVAVLVDGFDVQSIRYAKLSFSSKIPVYLMSGCYIFAIGPRICNSIRYVKENDLGVVCYEQDVEYLLHQLRELCLRSEAISVCGLRNREFALRYHSKTVSQSRFATVLSEANTR